MENIKLAYLKQKSKLVSQDTAQSEIEIVRKSADVIIKSVEKALLAEVRGSSNIEVTSESINVSLQIVLIDAFIRCKILEEPT